MIQLHALILSYVKISKMRRMNLFSGYIMTQFILGCVNVTLSPRYRSMALTIRGLQGSKLLMSAIPRLEASIMPQRMVPMVEEPEDEEPPALAPLHQSSTVRLPSRRLWKGLHQVPHIFVDIFPDI